MKYKDSVTLELETVANRLETMRNGLQNNAYTQPVLIREIKSVGSITNKVLGAVTKSNDMYYKDRIETNLKNIVNKLSGLLHATETNSKTVPEFLNELKSTVRLVEFVNDTVSLENREL